jgi:arylsulfatase A-like enzyme
MDALEAHGLTETTLVIFTTDHGIQSKRDKWTLYDPGVETACIFRGPGLPPNESRAELFCNVDLLPTILELSGNPIPGDLDGNSRAKWIQEGDRTDAAEEVFGIYYNGACRSVRTPAYKLIWNLCPSPYEAEPPVGLDDSDPTHPRPVWELYDLAEDPAEIRNRAGDAEVEHIEKELRLKLLTWLRNVKDPSICCEM